MKAVTWHGSATCASTRSPTRRSRSRPTRSSAITSTGDLRLRPAPVRGARAVHDAGDILGHEPMGIVEEVGGEVTDIAAGRPRRDPVQHLVRRTASCASQGLQSQCETTQVREQGTRRRAVRLHQALRPGPGGQAEFLRVPQAHYGPIKVPEGPPDERFVYLSDVLPTAWQAVEYAAIPDGGSVRGARPRADRRHGRRIAQHRGAGA